ncbi:MAG: acylneuraminate cytidylyltransferase [delta proteobacterium MLS_D]|nr:MAG: acylneuraminate cytidylyltransferase [delta proteobacterium MLS_D]
MRIFAFVFARGGSKGLPGKNIRLLMGKPLLGWSIDTAKQIERIDRVFVSTEDPEISEVAIRFGAEVIERPPELATDSAAEWLAWQHAVKVAEERHGSFDIFLSLPATAPLRKVDDVISALDALTDDRDVVVTMTESRRSPWFNMVMDRGDGALRTVMQTDGKFVRRQDAPKTYDLTTVAYATRPAFVKNSNGIWDGRVSGVEVPLRSAVDIDTIDDFLYAEYLLTSDIVTTK